MKKITQHLLETTSTITLQAWQAANARFEKGLNRADDN
jgi:hypothetical protein